MYFMYYSVGVYVCACTLRVRCIICIILLGAILVLIFSLWSLFSCYVIFTTNILSGCKWNKIFDLIFDLIRSKMFSLQSYMDIFIYRDTKWCLKTTLWFYTQFDTQYLILSLMACDDWNLENILTSNWFSSTFHSQTSSLTSLIMTRLDAWMWNKNVISLVVKVLAAFLDSKRLALIFLYYNI